MLKSLQRSFVSALLAGSLLFLPTYMVAQTRSISGTISSRGNPVEDAKIVAHDEQLDQKFRAESAESGNYSRILSRKEPSTKADLLRRE